MKNATKKIQIILFAGIIVVFTITSSGYLFTTDSALPETQSITDYGERYITTIGDSPKQFSGESGGIIPEISIDFPAEVRFGEPFEVNIPYTYVGFDHEDGEVDWIVELPNNHFLNSSSIWDPDNPGTILRVTFPEELKLLNDPGLGPIESEVSETWKHTSYKMNKIILYDITQEHNIKLVFNMTKQMNYPLEYVVIVIDMFPLEYYFNEYDGVYKPSLVRDPPQFAPGAEPQPPCPYCGDFEVGPSFDPDYDQMRPNMETERDILNSWGDELLENLGYETIEDYIRGTTASDWAEEFLTKYPEFKKQAINLDSVFNFLLPSAYGQLQFVSVTGKSLIQDDAGRFLVPSTQITACLVDENLALNNGTYTVLKNGLTDVCKLVSLDGSFTLFGNGDDPDNTDPLDRADIAIRFELKNNKITHVKDDQDGILYYYSDTMSNHNTAIVRLPNTQINNSENFAKTYQIYDKINDGYKHFNELGYGDIPTVKIRYNPKIIDNTSGLSYRSSQINLQDLPSKNIKDYPVTILHEFGHHIQKTAYDKKNTDIPTCTSLIRTHGSNIPTHEKCAWSEGWATFVGLWVEDTSQYQSFTRSHNLNFETATINGNQLTTLSPSITEGWITTALIDIVDDTNEQHDDLSSEDQKLWNAFANNRYPQSVYNSVAGSIYEFQKDWDAETNHPSLQNIFFLNKLTDSPIINSTLSKILDEPFNNLDAWTKQGELDWRIGIPDEGGHPPNQPGANMVAETDNCDTECILVLTNGLDFTSYNSVTLSLYRYVDNSLDSGEYLKIDVSSNGGTSWSNIFTWNGGTHDDDTWHKETFNLASYLDSTDFKVRAVAKASSSAEDLIIDDLKIFGVKKSTSDNAIFSDNFEGTFSKWTLSSDDDDNWEINTVQRPGTLSSNKVAHSANCDKNCYMTSNTINTSGTNTELSFYRYIATSIDNNEGLKVQASTNNGNSWTQLVFLSANNDNDDSTWTKETIDLSSYQSSQLKIRFNAVSSSNSEHVRIDDVTITPKGTITSSTASFNENFDNLNSWTMSGDDRWTVVSTWNEDNPTTVSTNKFATAKNCDDTCTLTLTNFVDISSLNSANLEVSRFVDSSLDNAEYLGIDVYDGTTWRNVATWSDNNNEDTDEWEIETINISSYLDDQFKIRINAQMSSNSEDVGIDYIRVVPS